jgi:hypothetical protein
MFGRAKGLPHSWQKRATLGEPAAAAAEEEEAEGVILADIVLGRPVEMPYLQNSIYSLIFTLKND